MNPLGLDPVAEVRFALTKRRRRRLHRLVLWGASPARQFGGDYDRAMARMEEDWVAQWRAFAAKMRAAGDQLGVSAAQAVQTLAAAGRAPEKASPRFAKGGFVPHGSTDPKES